jgi:hypothetical protein
MTRRARIFKGSNGRWYFIWYSAVFRPHYICWSEDTFEHCRRGAIAEMKRWRSVWT